MPSTVTHPASQPVREGLVETTRGATLIHVFVTRQDQQLRLIEELCSLADQGFSAEAGCRSVGIARSLDAERVVMDTVWTNLAAYRSALARPRNALRWNRIRALTTREIDVHVYDLATRSYSVASYPTPSPMR